MTPTTGPTVRRSASIVTVVAVVLAALSACSTASSSATAAGDGGVVRVVAAENFWGSIVAQLGGSHVQVTSIIDRPDADPHDYEPTSADARAVASAQLVVVNGIGYDTWASKLVAANPESGRTVLTVGTLLGVPDGGNPHRWYDPSAVAAVAAQVTADLKALDPADAASFDAQARTFATKDLAGYHAAIASIRRAYGGTPVGASESIFAMLAPALGLRLLTPPGLLKAVSEGTEPTAADKSTADAQIADHAIKVYVYNSQNATPDVQAQVREAEAAGIPVTTITETLTPATASFEQWQTTQLLALRAALARAVR